MQGTVIRQMTKTPDPWSKQGSMICNRGENSYYDISHTLKNNNHQY